MSLALDHLVVAARTLDDGVAWCEASLGITPGAGGRHALMGTHNRVFSIASSRFPRAYFEIIAIDPQAPPPGRARWFDLDMPALQAACEHKPHLVHWVVRCNDIVARTARLRADGIERGEVLATERDTEHGLLRWGISVRPDGARLFGGALPTLIEWGGRHPCDAMAPSGVVLDSFEVAGLPPTAVNACVPSSVQVVDAPAPLSARLMTPRGAVMLHAPSLGDDANRGEAHVQP